MNQQTKEMREWRTRRKKNKMRIKFRKKVMKTTKKKRDTRFSSSVKKKKVLICFLFFDLPTAHVARNPSCSSLVSISV